MGKTKPGGKVGGTDAVAFDGPRERASLSSPHEKKSINKCPEKKGGHHVTPQKFLWVKISWSLSD